VEGQVLILDLDLREAPWSAAARRRLYLRCPRYSKAASSRRTHYEGVPLLG